MYEKTYNNKTTNYNYFINSRKVVNRKINRFI